MKIKPTVINLEEKPIFEQRFLHRRKEDLMQKECECADCHELGNQWNYSEVYDSLMEDTDWICSDCLNEELVSLASSTHEMREYIENEKAEDFYLDYVVNDVLDTEHIKWKMVQLVKGELESELRKLSKLKETEWRIMTDYCFDNYEQGMFSKDYGEYIEDKFVKEKGATSI